MVCCSTIVCTAPNSPDPVELTRTRFRQFSVSAIFALFFCFFFKNHFLCFGFNEKYIHIYIKLRSPIKRRAEKYHRRRFSPNIKSMLRLKSKQMSEWMEKKYREQNKINNSKGNDSWKRHPLLVCIILIFHELMCLLDWIKMFT